MNCFLGQLSTYAFERPAGVCSEFSGLLFECGCSNLLTKLHNLFLKRTSSTSKYILCMCRLGFPTVNAKSMHVFYQGVESRQHLFFVLVNVRASCLCPKNDHSLVSVFGTRIGFMVLLTHKLFWRSTQKECKDRVRGRMAFHSAVSPTGSKESDLTRSINCLSSLQKVPDYLCNQ